MKLNSRKLWNFKGGVHPEGHKSLSNSSAIKDAKIPSVLVLPLQQHIGAVANPLVVPGQRVLKGELIAQGEGMVSASLHAPTSGTITAIEERPIPHPSGLMDLCIILESDQEDRWCSLNPIEDPLQLDADAIREAIRAAGIVGLGGAGFPAHVKLNPGAHTEVDTLIINGAECEPYITCDDRLMRERAESILCGIEIMARAISAHHILIGVEDNKPEAIAALNRALQHHKQSRIEIVTVPTLYPTGGERQLIKVLTGKEVPTQGIPLDIGIVCHNVATAARVEQAVVHGRPLISRVVTVSGEAIPRPGNYEVLFGTPMADLIAEAGGTIDQQPATIIMGGPMMGLPVTDSATPVTKTCNCLLIQPVQPRPTLHQPCIRCGECAISCPAQLQPQQLYWHARAKEFDKVQDEHLFDCIECGCCSWVCPSQIPLVHYFRFAKAEIWSQEREKAAADIARERHEFRQLRIEREKAERAELMKRKKAALAKKKKSGVSGSKESIAAAVERTKAKKAALAAKEAKAATEPSAPPTPPPDATENRTDEGEQREI
ncbi:MAG: electron transport complex subunit RsxC [Gammaproteobacteria bacterium]|nr:electron transport complex subunit RsxC [Gammaproteobacteria bacterium]